MSTDTRLIGTKPLYFPALGGLTIKNLGASTIYYGPATVSSTSYTGTCSAGASTTLTTSYYFVCAGQSLMQLDYETEEEDVTDDIATLTTSVATLTTNLATEVTNRTTGVSGALAVTVAGLAKSKGVAKHADTASFTRPTGFASIEWQGTVEPDNAVEGDTWIDTSTE